MPNAQNQEMLTNIKADLEGASAVWVVDYRGLTVKEIQALRRSIREADARAMRHAFDRRSVGGT